MRHDLPEWDEDPYGGQKPGLFPSWWHLLVFLAGVGLVFWLICEGIKGAASILGG